MPLEFAGPGTRLTPADIAAGALAHGLEPALVQAVTAVEAGGRGFLPDGRPKILFEAHRFHALTGGRHDRGYPSVSSPVWNRALYSKTTEGEYTRLALAASLDRDAALKSASWGLFQIMGSNHAACGHADVESFVAAMVEGEAAHLQAFLAFVCHEGLAEKLTARDWDGFARGYNGPAYAEGGYQTKLAAAYGKACDAAPPAAAPVKLCGAQALNVRTGPGANNPLCGVLTKDQVVTVLLRDPSGWAHVSFSKGSATATGWVNANYLA